MSSVLLPLPPRGMGTAQVEAFFSYFGRLAQLHTCSILQLARFLSSWRSRELGRRVTLNRSTLYTTKGSGMLSFGVCVETYVDAVEHAMGVDNLRRCTLIPIRGALNPYFGAIRGTRAWCERCFGDDAASGNPAYDRLLWTLQASTRCPEHRVALRITCPTCGVTQHFQHRSGNPLLCWRCDRSLIGPVSQLHPAPAPALGERDLCELVAVISSGGPLISGSNPFHAFQRALTSIVSPLAPIVSRVATVNGSARARNAEVKPTLRTMLRRAHAAGVTVLQVLVDPEGAAAAAGQLIFDQNAVAATARVRHTAEVVAEVRQAMKLELKKPHSKQIPQIKKLASRCGVSEGFIRHRLPQLLKRYQRHRRAASISLTNSRRWRCWACLNDPAQAVNYLARAKTLREAVQRLATDADCPIALARLELRRYRVPRT
jgi:hypothetical protein